MDTLKARLEFYMRQKGFNPTNLSRRAGLSITSVRDILQHPGKPDPRITTVVKLCKALDIKPYQLSPDIEEFYRHAKDWPDRNEKPTSAF
jgi:DNA-binding Xre family transcriptional regulator